MSKKLRLISAGITVAAISAFSGFMSAKIMAASVTDPLPLAADSSVGTGIYVGKGEDAEALKRAAALGITAYEQADKEGGGGALQKTLIDNDAVKVNLVSFKKGFTRPGGMKRRYDTLLVYIDPGRYTIMKTGAGTPAANSVPAKLAPGSSVFHRKESIVSETRIDEDYRVLFVEMKK